MNADPQSTPFSPSLAEIAAALEDTLFDGGEPIVVALKGGWGEGKTYFWKKSVVPSLGKAGDVEPGYVSVFGAESLSAIQREVIVEAIRTRPKGRIGDTLQKTIERTFPFLRATKGALNSIGGKFGFTTDTLNVPPEVIQRVVLRSGWVVCLDDIERLPTNIELDALFGYVSTLRDEHKLNVVLIYNEEKIPDKQTEALKRYAEKTVDREFAFVPQISEIVELVFKDTISEQSLHELTEKCQTLDLRNIRILARAKRYYQDVVKALPMSPDPQYLSAILSSLLLFSWVKFARVDAAELTLSFLEQYDGTWNFEGDDEEETDGQQRVLNNYPYAASDDLDRVLIRFVEGSVLDTATIQNHYQEFLVEKRRELAGQRLDRAWQHFHGNFGDREIEFGDELYATLKEHMEFLPINRIDSAMVELDRMGRRGDVEALLDQLRTQRSNRFADYDDFFGQLRYPGLIELVQEAKRRASADERSLDEVVASVLGEGEGLVQPRDGHRLAQFSEDDFFSYFSSTERRGLTATLRDLVKATSIRGADQQDVAINEILRKVAQRLAATSPMNRSRIEAIGLLEEDSPKSSK